MRILITGATGLLGSKLFNLLVREHDVSGTCFTQSKKSKQFLDIRDKELVFKHFENFRPDVVVHTAAMSNADFCELNKEKAREINVIGTKNVAKASKIYNAKLVYISSDYIFNGMSKKSYEEDSKPEPINYYGKTKLEGELIVKKLNNYLIVRPTILYGFNHYSTKETYVDNVINELSSGKELFVDNKIIKFPLLLDDLTNAIKELINKEVEGTFNIGSARGVTKYEWAQIIADTFSLDKSLIKESTGNNLVIKPENVCFSSRKIKGTINVGIKNIDLGMQIYKAQKGCMFRMIYSVKPDQLVLGQNASTYRINLGKKLAEEQPVEADAVMPVPESGIFGATGYSAQSKIPLYFGIIRDYYTRKTLFETNKGLRSELLRQKLIFVPDLIKNKRIVVVDEAILSGTTLEFVIARLKREGAKEIHVRIPSPPMRFNCKFNVLGAEANLLAKEFRELQNYEEYKLTFEDRLKKNFGVDSLRFLSMKSFLKFMGSDFEPCTFCFR
jgi:dTDP-4-dehydrorhamnose reductase